MAACGSSVAKGGGGAASTWSSACIATARAAGSIPAANCTSPPGSLARSSSVASVAESGPGPAGATARSAARASSGGGPAMALASAAQIAGPACQTGRQSAAIDA